MPASPPSKEPIIATFFAILLAGSIGVYAVGAQGPAALFWTIPLGLLLGWAGATLDNN